MRLGRWTEADFASIDWFPTVAALTGIDLDEKTKAWIKVVRSRVSFTLIIHRYLTKRVKCRCITFAHLK